MAVLKASCRVLTTAGSMPLGPTRPYGEVLTTVAGGVTRVGSGLPFPLPTLPALTQANQPADERHRQPRHSGQRGSVSSR